jgi:hypothetical protein
MARSRRWGFSPRSYSRCVLAAAENTWGRADVCFPCVLSRVRLPTGDIVRPTFDVAHATDLLARTPGVLGALLPGSNDVWSAATEGPGTWSPRDVVAHMADLEVQDWMTRVRLIMAASTTPFPPIDRTRFETTLGREPVDRLIAIFATRRAENLRALEDLRLSAADLSKPGIHPALGSVTLSQLLAAWTVHDLTHIAQIARVMARRYDEAVGPWAEYLGILSWRR